MHHLNTTEFTLVVGLGALAAGFLGSLTGLGGGIIVTPLLTLLCGVNIRYAMGASLVSVIATSSGAAAAYVKEGLSNMRAGMFLEIATTTGAVLGAAITLRLPTGIIAIVFGIVLLYSAIQSTRIHTEVTTDDRPQDRVTRFLRMDSTYPSLDGLKSYRVHSVPGGFGVSFGAGIVSGLLGIGGGALKVVAMDQVMRLPFKVSTTTSNFMIGVTAAASAGLYLKQGYVDPGLVMPVMLGVLLGALVGARVLPRTRSKYLRVIFAVAVTVLAVEMIYHGISGRL
jgi:uncharacterized protein